MGISGLALTTYTSLTSPEKPVNHSEFLKLRNQIILLEETAQETSDVQFSNRLIKTAYQRRVVLCQMGNLGENQNYVKKQTTRSAEASLLLASISLIGLSKNDT